MGAGLLPRPAGRQARAALHRLRPRADRADRAPDARRRRGPARAGFPGEARPHDARTSASTRSPTRLHPSYGHGGGPAARRPDAAGMAQPVLRRGPAGRRRRGGRLRRERAEGVRPLAAQAERSGRAHPASEQPRRGAAALASGTTPIDDGCGSTSRPTPTATRPARTTASSFQESDYAAIPRRDLPFGVPDFLGDDSAGRTGHPRHNNRVARPTPDDGHTLIWAAPEELTP